MAGLGIKNSLQAIMDMDKASHNEASLSLIYDKLTMVAANVKHQLDDMKKFTYINNFVLASLGDTIDQEVIDTVQKQQEQLIVSNETDPEAIPELQMELSQVRTIITYAMSKYSLADIKFINTYDIAKHNIYVDEFSTGYLQTLDIKYKTTEHGDWWVRNGKDYKSPKCKSFTLEHILSLIEKQHPDIDIILHTGFIMQVSGDWEGVIYG